MDLNLKSLIGKLNKTCHRALESAAGMCLSRTNYNVEIEHWLFRVNEDPESDVSRILRHFEINPDAVNRGLSKALDRLKTGNARTPALSPGVVSAVQNAWLLSSVDFGYTKIRSGTLLLAILLDSGLKMQISEASPELGRLDPGELRSRLAALLEGGKEDAESRHEVGSGAAAGPTGTATGGGKTESLDQFTVDVTAQARSGKIDPVIGRDREIDQIIDILTRRRQNNPILTGEAGVGKTAVVEGFALRIATGDVPPPLKNAVVRSLDLGLLQAGAGIKGEFENRLRSVIDEVKASPVPIILFIDEAHTLIGAGGSAGQGDAANLLKPALARGELRTIAATTWAEYKKYFEKDAALTRRFQVVKVEEPHEDTAVRMMRGLASTLEKHHSVTILDEAIGAAVRFSARYLSGRQLPDKAVSLLDTACARVSLSQSTTPATIADANQQIMLLETEKRILLAEESTGSDHQKRLEGVEENLARVREDLALLEKQHAAEREVSEEMLTIHRKLRSTSQESGEDPLPADEREKLRKRLGELQGRLAEIQGKRPLVRPCVDESTVAEVISGWTGIPIGRMVTDEIHLVLRLEKELGERIIGQDHALNTIARRIQTSRANLDDPGKPVGVFLLVGPSGVGKTETALALADLLYGGERNVVTINMSEYQEAHTVSSLKGSPPGYVGYGEGGVLTEAVRRKPYSVVLLDEVEKAHPDVMELFFQVFDKGMLEDGEGRDIDFRNTIILLTSNVATDRVMTLCADPDTRPDAEGLARAIRPELEKAFPPALLGRLVVVAYYPIQDEIMKRIIRLKLDKISRRVAANHGVKLAYDEALVGQVVDRCKEVSSGARNVDHILSNSLLPELSREFLGRMADGRPIQQVRVSIDHQGAFTYGFE